MSSISDSLTVAGDITASGTLYANVNRSNIITETGSIMRIPLENLRVHDALHTLLPTIGATDDIGLATGTIGTNPGYLKSANQNAVASATEYARGWFMMPRDYVASSTFYLRICAGVVDGTLAASSMATSATVDFEAYMLARTLVVGSDVVTTGATSVNAAITDYNFTCTATGVTAGKVFDFRMTWAMVHNVASDRYLVAPHLELVYSAK